MCLHLAHLWAGWQGWTGRQVKSKCAPDVGRRPTQSLTSLALEHGTHGLVSASCLNSSSYSTVTRTLSLIYAHTTQQSLRRPRVFTLLTH